jgi:hypothetical protein
MVFVIGAMVYEDQGSGNLEPWVFSFSEGDKAHTAKIAAAHLRGFVDPCFEGVSLQIDGQVLYEEAF